MRLIVPPGTMPLKQNADGKSDYQADD